MTQRKCITLNCSNELSERSNRDTCAQCRASYYYWRKKKPVEVLTRRVNLAKYANRLDNSFPSLTQKRKAK